MRKQLLTLSFLSFLGLIRSSTQEKLTAQIEDLKTKILETQSQLDEVKAKLG